MERKAITVRRLVIGLAAIVAALLTAVGVQLLVPSTPPPTYQNISPSLGLH